MSAIGIYQQLRADFARRFKRLTATLPRPVSTRLPLDAGADAVVRCDCMREVADVHGGRLCRLQEWGGLRDHWYFSELSKILYQHDIGFFELGLYVDNRFAIGSDS